MFFYKKIIIISALKFRITLTFTYLIKLFRTTMEFTLINVFAINI